MSMKCVKGLACATLVAILACGIMARPVHADECSGFNQAFAQNSAAHQQDLLKAAMNASSQFPIVPAVNSCFQSITNMMKMLPIIADPSAASGILSTIINNLVSMQCSQIMGTISSVSGGLSNMAKVCVPMPNFGFSGSGSGLNLNLPSTCNGTTVLSTTSASLSGSSSTSFLDYLK